MGKLEISRFAKPRVLRTSTKHRNRREKQNSHLPNGLQKQHNNRKRFQKQVEVETAARHDESPEMTTTNKATRLAKEREATRIRGEEFEKW